MSVCHFVPGSDPAALPWPSCSLQVVAEVGAAGAALQKVTMLVLGTQDDNELNGYEKSSKHRKVELLTSKGSEIQIPSERDFFELMGVDAQSRKSWQETQIPRQIPSTDSILR